MQGARSYRGKSALREPFSKTGELAADFGKARRYAASLDEITRCVQSAHVRSLFASERQGLAVHWEIGREIAQRQDAEGWSVEFVRQLACDLKVELPERKGFSLPNLSRMADFFRTYPGLGSHRLRPIAESDGAYCGLEEMYCWVRQLPWGSNVLLMESLPDPALRRWYMQQAVWREWSRTFLRQGVRCRLHERRSRGKPGYFTSDRCQVDHILNYEVIDEHFTRFTASVEEQLDMRLSMDDLVVIFTVRREGNISGPLTRQFRALLKKGIFEPSAHFGGYRLSSRFEA